MADFHLTAKQQEANRLLGGPARHILLEGGSRSGKTFLIMRAIILRAFAHRSRHAVLRYRFNHVKSSIIFDTLPKVVDLCLPKGTAEECDLNKSDWFFRLPNGSEIWFGGLDDRERTEKILGNEFASIFLNECSQIPYASRNIARTRLAQKTELRPRFYYDANPPIKVHWLYQVFHEHRDPDTRLALPDPEQYAYMRMNPADNVENLPAEYIADLEALPERLRRRFLLGEYVDAVDGALWTLEGLDRGRLVSGELPELSRVVVAVDPSGCSGPEDERSDEIGISVVALGVDGRGYVLEDLSGRFGPNEWARIAIKAYQRWEANCIVAEVNFGGAMVQQTLRAARLPGDQPVAFREVRASRGKVIRAEPIAQLFEDGKICLAGRFARLEDQLCGMSMDGYKGGRSPDRADAMIWGMTDLFNRVVHPRPKEGYVVPGLPLPKPPPMLPPFMRDGWMLNP